MTKTSQSIIKSAFRSTSFLRTRDLEAHGIWWAKRRDFVAEGTLQRVGRGLYSLPSAETSENRSLAEAGKRIPQGVICLLLALRFHELTTQYPPEIWLAINGKSREPKISYLPLRIVCFSENALTEGQEEHSIERVRVKSYGSAKTVADCFKYRNKIGLDIALEALQEVWRKQQCNMSDLMRYARICRVANVMRSYLETLS